MLFRLVVFLCAYLVLLSVSDYTYYDEVGQYPATSEVVYPGSRYGPSIALFGEGSSRKLYVFGGSSMSKAGGSETKIGLFCDMWKFTFEGDSGVWTLINNDTIPNTGCPEHYYHESGSFSGDVYPGSRALTQHGKIGNTWVIFGGQGTSPTNQAAAMCDFWKFHTNTDTFEFVLGESCPSPYQSSISTPKDNVNYPGARYGGSMVTYSNDLYLYGGFAFSGSGSTTENYFCDFWKYKDGTGWSYINEGCCKDKSCGYKNEKSVYSGSSLYPGSRWGHSSATIGTYLYVFGGNGFSDTTTKATLCDMWRFNLDSGQQQKWEFVAGGSCASNYVTKDAIHTGQFVNPGSRHGAGMAVLNQKIYLFGGDGCDMFRYSYETNWTWIEGSSCPEKTTNKYYPQKGKYDSTNLGNYPGSRNEFGMTSTAIDNEIYVFGGSGQGPIFKASSGRLRDLWTMKGQNHKWYVHVDCEAKNCKSCTVFTGDDCESCLSGFPYDSTNKVCCPSSCATCTKWSNCETCKTSGEYYKDEGKCVSECGWRKYKDTSEGKKSCEWCPSNCARCVKGQNDQYITCLECVQGKDCGLDDNGTKGMRIFALVLVLVGLLLL